MVLLLPKVSSFGEQFGTQLGGGLSEGMNQAIENKKIQELTGLNLSGISDPNTRDKLLADQLAFGRKMKQAKASQEIDYSTGESLKNRMGEQLAGQQQPRRPRDLIGGMEEEDRYQGMELPEFPSNLPKKSFGNVPREAPRKRELAPRQKIQQREGPGNFPQPETAGIKQPLLNQDELLREGQRIAQKQTEAGIPTTPMEGLDIARNIEQDKKMHNAEVEKDIEQKVQAEMAYGKLGVDKLLKVYPDATDEQKALFMRKGEERGRSGKSESEINRELAKDAADFANTLINVKNGVKARGLLTAIKGSLLGSDRAVEKSIEDNRIKIKPLLDEGLFDTARMIISDKGYYPEEVEATITDLGENSKKSVANLPDMKTTTKSQKTAGIGVAIPGGQPTPTQKRIYTPEESQQIKNNIKETLTSDPSSNLILLRKAYDQKGVQWDEFKDQLNSLILSGEIKLNEDQFKMLNILEQPRLDNLDKILKELHLRR
jgi:hypothetical protein